MNAALGWALAVAAVAAGYAGYGWRGVALAVSVIVFWLLLQFSRALRVMRMAAGRPVGRVPNAVMLHARLKPGMTLMQILPLTGSLGTAVAPLPDETFAWQDDAGDRVQVVLRNGRLAEWRLERAAAAADEAEHAQAGEHQGHGAGLGHGGGEERGA